MIKKFIYVILVALACFACQRSTNSRIIGNNNKVDSSLIKVDERYRHNIVKHTYYNGKETARIDSIKLYYADTKTLESVEYRPALETRDNKWVSQIKYRKSGKKYSVLYEYDNPKKGDTIRITYYPTGIISAIETFATDPVKILTSTEYSTGYESFYENGVLKEKGAYDQINYQRDFQVGLWSYYDSTGILVKTENYIYPNVNQYYVTRKEYYNNGAPKSEKQYTDLISNSESSEPEKPIGTWKYYDIKGNLIKTERYE